VHERRHPVAAVLLLTTAGFNNKRLAMVFCGQSHLLENDMK
jgi:hypothetical protein